MKPILVIAFGSQIRGTSGATSDFDAAVLSDHSLSLKEKSKLVSRLASKLKIAKEEAIGAGIRRIRGVISL